MGRYNFAPQRVHQAATRLLETERWHAPPPWYNVIANIPPSERLVRPALQGAKKRGKKASRLFQPVKLQYREDSLRLDFFGDHPWELARPRQVLEDDGKDYQRSDWSQLEQTGKQTDGESVVQRQAWLMRLIRHELDVTSSRDLREYLRSLDFVNLQQTIKNEHGVDIHCELPTRTKDTDGDATTIIHLDYHPDQPHDLKAALKEVTALLSAHGTDTKAINKRHLDLAFPISDKVQSRVSPNHLDNVVVPQLRKRFPGIEAASSVSETFEVAPTKAERPTQAMQSIRLTFHRNSTANMSTAIEAFAGLVGVRASQILHRTLPVSDVDTYHAHSKASAYDQARKEFYAVRHRQDIERRVAREEALFVGANFGPSAIEVGMQLEDQKFEEWREWAVKEVTAQKTLQGAAYTGLQDENAILDADDPATQEGLNELADSVPGSKAGLEARGGALVHP